jgi:hypothetical protein
MVGPLAKEDTNVVALNGTMTGDGELPELLIRDRGGHPFRFEVKRHDPSASALPAKTAEIDLTTDCVRPSCEFVVRSGSTEKAVPLASTAAGLLIVVPESEISIRFVSRFGRSSPVSVLGESRRDTLLGLANIFAKAYAILTPPLAGLAGVGLLLGIALRRRATPCGGLIAVTLACATAVATRAILLTYIGVTSFPAVDSPYLSSASPFVLMFVVLGLYVGAGALIGLFRRGSTPRRPQTPDGMLAAD